MVDSPRRSRAAASQRPALADLLDDLERRHGRPAKPPPRRALDWILWENVAYLVDDSKRAAAYAELERATGLDPKRIRAAKSATLVAVTRLGGIHPELRADRLREIAELALDEFGGDLDAALDAAATPRDALAALKKFPAIGTPGAEKVLMTTRRLPVLALESNGLRTLTRLGYGFADKNYDKSYRSVREAVQPELAGRDCDWLVRAHHLLRRHGQELCKNTKPQCFDCPVQVGCAWFRNGMA
jgi:endonuclease-3